MKELTKKKRIIATTGVATAGLGIIFAITSLSLSLVNSIYSVYTLAVAIIFLGGTRICYHLSNYKSNMFYNIFFTAFIFILSVLVSLTKFSIYFLTVSFFAYCLAIIVNRIMMIRKDHSVQSIILNSLIIAFAFVYSFIFFFPSVYGKHATSVSNSNFIVLSYAFLILGTCIKNILIPFYYKLKLNNFVEVLKKTLVLEILMGLFLLIVLCSIYFLLGEPGITSFVDALWYCFAVITTIGFGDVYVSTTFGRILSVILGLYGIALVALFTSLIVNFYNEASKKRGLKMLSEIKDVTEHLEKIENKEEDQKESED